MPDVDLARVSAAIRTINGTMSECQRAFDQSQGHRTRGESWFADPKGAAESLLDRAFLQTLAMLESVGARSLLELAREDYREARSGDMLKTRIWEEGPYLVWAARVDHYLEGLSGGLGISQ